MNAVPTPPRAAVRNPRVWLFPAVVVIGLMTLLAGFYLDSIADPEASLHDFPVALVNQDEGELVPGPSGEQKQNFGDQIAAAIGNGIDPDQIDLRQVGIAEAQQQLQSADVYGVIIIPSDFSKRLLILAAGSVVPGEIEKPVITVQSNPRAGTFASAIMDRIGDQAMTQVNSEVGKQLTGQVQQQLAGPPPTPIPGASALTLAEPVNVLATEYNPLPGGTGNGLAAFYYALLLVLAGFTGAMIVHTMVDQALGFAPTEYGPWYRHLESIGISRFNTLMLKWTVMAAIALVVSGIYVGVGHLVGMPIDRALALYLFGVLGILAVGVTALSVLALFGTAGLLINLVVFIVLGLPSSGGTVPLEAQPPVFGWLAKFEPMHQLYLGARSILFFDAGSASGLGRSAVATLIGLAIGLTLGIVTTRVYDRAGLHRRTRPETASVP
ncbi:SNG1 family protein [Aldersonia sp. NBC_00410]|uniref:YhgE/Pip domain-containing protein n=1 Tax=Aldersonia sp. NBC_00410 TaxID=2975954 RepID=UPI0022527EB1|nr:ABC transporter permease [Aldersonia sp. NBC_00410]MCX5043427.1 SNG1 family protein [Aldersonia sp. NBC_00410]